MSLTFKSVRLDSASRKKVAEAVADLSRELGREFVVGTALFGWRVMAACAGGCTIVPAFAVGWPRDSSIVALAEDGKSLLPRAREADFKLLCLKFKLDSEDDVAQLNELVNPSKFDRRNWKKVR